VTFINWISIGLVALIVIVGLCVTIYGRKKLRDLDGFMGIDSSDAQEDE